MSQIWDSWCFFYYFLSVLQITSSLLICLQVCWFFLLPTDSEVLQRIVNFGFVFFYLVLLNNFYVCIGFYLNGHCFDALISLNTVSFHSLNMILIAEVSGCWIRHLDLFRGRSCCLLFFFPSVWITLFFFFTCLIVFGWKLDILELYCSWSSHHGTVVNESD